MKINTYFIGFLYIYSLFIKAKGPLTAAWSLQSAAGNYTGNTFSADSESKYQCQSG
jgi:hypothetical protein